MTVVVVQSRKNQPIKPQLRQNGRVLSTMTKWVDLPAECWIAALAQRLIQNPF